MLTSGSKLTVKDNSGIILAQCIQITKAKKSKSPGIVGDFIKATIRKISAKSQPQKPVGNQCLRNLVIIQSKKVLRRLDGGALSFSENSGVIVNEKKLPLFKRVSTVVPLELKKNCGEVLNLAKSVI